MFSRTRALQILDQWVTKDFTRKHLLATEAVMRAYAGRLNADPEQWGIAGLLHDADWDSFPDVHPAKIVELLRAEGEMEIAQAFAAQVSRDDILTGPKELGVELDAHLQLVIEAMQGAGLGL